MIMPILMLRKFNRVVPWREWMLQAKERRREEEEDDDVMDS